MRYIKLFEEFSELEQIMAHFVEETGADRFFEVPFFKGSEIVKVYEIEFPDDRVDVFYRAFEEKIEGYREILEDLGYGVETTRMVYEKRYAVTLYKIFRDYSGNLPMKAYSEFLVEKYSGLEKRMVTDPYGDEWVVYYDVSDWVFGHRVDAYFDNPKYRGRRDVREATFNFDTWFPFQFYVGLLIGQCEKIFKPLIEEYGLSTSDEATPRYFPFSHPDQDDEGF